jgi:hypothetical protein
MVLPHSQAADVIGIKMSQHQQIPDSPPCGYPAPSSRLRAIRRRPPEPHMPHYSDISRVLLCEPLRKRGITVSQAPGQRERCDRARHSEKRIQAPEAGLITDQVIRRLCLQPGDSTPRLCHGGTVAGPFLYPWSGSPTRRSFQTASPVLPTCPPKGRKQKPALEQYDP